MRSRLISGASLAVLVLLSLSSAAFAQQVQGTVNSTITLSSACEVNGDTDVVGVDFGELDFGTHNTFFSQADAVVDGNGADAINIRCSSGAAASLAVENGANDGEVVGFTHAMVYNTSFVPYEVYTSASRTTPLENGELVSITGTGANVPVSLYGRATGVAGLVPGTYTDTLTITLTF